MLPSYFLEYDGSIFWFQKLMRIFFIRHIKMVIAEWYSNISLLKNQQTNILTLISFFFFLIHCEMKKIKNIPSIILKRVVNFQRII